MVTAVVVQTVSDPTPTPTQHEKFLHDELDNKLKIEKSDGLEPISLTASDHSENVTSTISSSSNTNTISDHNSDLDEEQQEEDYEEQDDQQIKCSAVHTLERDMPTFDYSNLVLELRQLIVAHAQQNPGTYSPQDLDKCQHDDWYLSRFLLRQQLDISLAFDMLKAALRFNHESLANHLKREDFPAEFYQLGGLLPYGTDRKGNKMLYLRVRVHKKTPEIGAIIQAFLYFNIKRLDDMARGRGISIVIDCSGGGLANADMDTLLFLITTLKNYFPKGLSYFLVHEIPWILKPFWHLAKAWVPEEHRQLIKFSNSYTINEYVDQQNLPAYLGGPGHLGGLEVPENCTTLEQAAKLWGVERPVLRRVLDKFKEHLPAETVARIEKSFQEYDDEDVDE